ncbi:hypothetical protein [Anaeroselena agilis]|uniref:Uncharacterized protein n=1 Tax=Anaeroselena agilis TaxID=3063788 RepID=A0ABU3P142_9FIRM|nr:hypothetical protein [Selenomonadales bacterium 4137-cl]
MTPILPVANGILPRPGGGRITGVFVVEKGDEPLAGAGPGRDVLVCPWVAEDGGLYPVGVAARILHIGAHTAVDGAGRELPVTTVTLEGQGHARWHTLKAAGGFVASPDVEALNLRSMRREYPAISGAGWLPAGGFTEFRDPTDIPVTIYGADIETGKAVNISANLGGLVSQEQAHTIEHGIIRALRTYGLCTPRTLLDSLARETAELKQSVELGLRFALPEILGRTGAGACGNQMTNLAQFYLAREFIDNVAAGKSFGRSLFDARRRTMSQLTGELGITMERDLRVLQGLKKGMSHDDTRLRVETGKRVIGRFAADPWG